jgi:hypothetical protein
MIDFLDRLDANYLTFRDRSETASPGDAAAPSKEPSMADHPAEIVVASWRS